MTALETEWIASIKGEFLITKQLSKGVFSDVYVAEHLDLAYERAWKVSRAVHNRDANEATRVMTLGIAGIEYVDVNSTEILERQFSKLQAATVSGGMIESYGLNKVDCSSVLEMKFLRNVQNLRDFIKHNAVSVELLAGTARNLDRLSLNSNFNFHGDLKPEHFLVSHGEGMLLIDPGHFGPLETAEGVKECQVTTPRYYPFLEPNDIFAFGVVLWEVALRRHPFDFTNRQRRLSSALTQLLNSKVHARQFLKPIFYLSTPSEIKPNLDKKLESILLRCLGLKLNGSGELDIGSRYLNFSEVSDDLLALSKSSISEL